MVDVESTGDVKTLFGCGLFLCPLTKVFDRGGLLTTLEGSQPTVKMTRKNLSGASGRLQLRVGRVEPGYLQIMPKR